MMPNSIDLLAGRPPYLPELFSLEPRPSNGSARRRSGGYLIRLNRYAHRLASLLF